MGPRPTRIRTSALLAAVLALAAALTLGGIAGAAKTGGKPRKGTTIDITQAGAPIPDAVGTTSVGVLASTIQVKGKKLKGMRIRDVNVTVQTTGSAVGAATQLVATLSAPGGATAGLFQNSLTGASIGPLTLDDESRLQLATTTLPRDPTQLVSPYQGTAQPNCALTRQGCALSAMDNSRATGTWTLRVFDNVAGGPATSSLVSWRLQVVAGPPFRSAP